MATDVFQYRYCFLDIKDNKYLLVEPSNEKDNLGTMTTLLGEKHHIAPLNVIAISKNYPIMVHLPPHDERRRFIEEYVLDHHDTFRWEEDSISLQV